MSDNPSKSEILGSREENEIHVTSQGKIKSYVSYATKLLEEKNFDSILFKAKGNAVTKAVTVVEIIKRLQGSGALKQETNIDSQVLEKTSDENREDLEGSRRIPVIEITLTTILPKDV
ncbi:hypothetical protein K7432_011750 [Basidiobolus ranarum]|uniref:DNA/RNA-binding protein Alba-like domain-containing protein n=1 Tax=Basidiobolus ranarum TaxID=34480 RepID=A0ABR2WLU7_9FUNG